MIASRSTVEIDRTRWRRREIVMSKATTGIVLMGFAVMLGFGTCAVFAVTYGQASTRLDVLMGIALFSSLALFLTGTVLLALGIRRK